MPGLVDIHVHVYHGEKGTAYAGGPLGVPIDAFSFRSCVTTVADADSWGWRNFDDYKARIIDKSKTRVTASSTSSATEWAAARSSRTSPTWK